MTAPGGGVVISPPVHAPFFFRLELLGRQVVEAPLASGPAGYDLDLDLAALDAALGEPGVAAYVLCNPHSSLNLGTSPELLAEAVRRMAVSLT